MPRFFILLICILLSVSVTAETVYKKTNPDGSVEFTDVNSNDSEEVKIRKPTTYTPSRLPPINLPVKKLKPKFHYNLVIEHPADNATIVGMTDVVVVASADMDLMSRNGHRFRYQLVGKLIDSQSPSVTFKDVYRGTHNLVVSIIDTKGEAVGSAVSRTFHMKRFFKKKAPK